MNNNNQFASAVQPGFYRHYKGHYYQVLAQVQHSEENVPYVLYRALYDDFALWVRPQTMFLESVQHSGQPVARFDYIGTQAPAGCPLPAQWQTSAEQTCALWAGFNAGSYDCQPEAGLT